MQQVPPPPPPFPGGSASPPPAALPAGWTEHWAPNNVPYYFNAATGVSTYVRPTLAASPPPPPGFDAVVPMTAATARVVSAVEPVQPKKEKKKKKEKPVEKLPIEGTPWIRVTTNEGNVFYTNAETKTSVWTVPEEIEEQVKNLDQQKQNGQAALLEAEKAAAAAAAAAEAARLLQEKEAEMQRLREELEREREASRKRKMQEEEEQQAREEEAQQASAKRARVTSVEVDDDDAPGGESMSDDHAGDDAQAAEEGEELEEWQKEELQAKKALEKELEEPAVASQITEFSSDEAIALFKIMLSEKDINPMRPWDMELPKFINDPRYRNIKTLRERRDLFDDHCKHLVRERRAKKAAGGEKADPATAYRALLVSEVKSTRTHWEDFRQKFKKDSRFRGFGRDDREREKAFRAWLRELGEIKRADALKAEEKFVTMLKETQIPDEARWSDIKSKFSSDPRYTAVASSSQREEIFKKYMATRPKPATEAQIRDSNAEEEDRRKAAAEEKKAKQQASLREREEKVRKEKAALDRAAGRVRAEAGREESTREYKNLLIDAVRDHEAKWNDVLPNLESDPRFSSNNLTFLDKRRLFDQHLDEIYDKRVAAVEALFAEHAPKLTTRFDDIYSSISASPVVTRLHLSESRIERLFDAWNKKRFDQARKDFDIMLSESKFVDYWGRLKQDAAGKEEERAKDILGADNEGGDDEMNAEDGVDLKAMAAQIDMKELNAVLKHDKRFTVFDHDPQAREQWVKEYIQKLDRPKQTVHQQSHT